MTERVLTADEFRAAIDWLSSIPGVDEESGDPLALTPPPDLPDLLWRDAWEAWPWNLNDATGTVSPRPPWEVVVLTGVRANSVEELRLWTREQISRNIYNAHDTTSEFYDKIDGKFTPEQNAGRDTIKALYQQHVRLIEAVTTVEEVGGLLDAARSEIIAEIARLGLSD